MASKSNLSVGIDIGTSKITALAGEKNEEGKIEIKGMSRVDARGIKRGSVFNIDEAGESIGNLINDLESQTGENIRKVNVTYAGPNVKTVHYRGYRYTSEGGVVSRSDISELYNEARNSNVEQGYSVLHTIPQAYLVDGEMADMNPVGITGRKIEADFLLITVPEFQLNNLNKALNKAGVEPEEITFSPIAVSEAVLTGDEMEIGAVVLDIGAGTTKIAVYYENVLVHTAVIPFGGNVITSDIKEGCSILAKWAEQLKIRYGQALGDFADEQKVVTIPGYNGWEPKEITFKSLAFIIQARMEEIIDSVFIQIEKSGVTGQVGSGIVITGGTASLNNLISLVKFRTGMDARKAFAVIHPVNKRKELQGQDYLSALGLLKLSLQNNITPPVKRKTKPAGKSKDNSVSGWKRVFQGVLDYIDDESDDVAMN